MHFVVDFKVLLVRLNLGSSLRENFYLLHPRIRLGHHPTPSTTPSSSFLAPLPRTLDLHQGESHTLNLFSLFLSCLVYLLLCLFTCLKKTKIISVVFILVLLSFIFCLVVMFPPKFGKKDISVGSVLIIGRSNIE